MRKQERKKDGVSTFGVHRTQNAIGTDRVQLNDSQTATRARNEDQSAAGYLTFGEA